jgi:hypothetical protein
MLTDYVALRLVPGGAWVGLRELCGHDEDAVRGTDTVTAIRLLDRLLVDGPGTTIGSGRVASLTASDRDRILAAVYGRTYGPRIESTAHCHHCGEPFDLDFSLQELLDGMQEQPVATVGEGSGVFQLPDGRRFRLPTGEDECAVLHLTPAKAEQELLARCVVEGDPADDLEAVQKAMQAIGPVLDVDLEARCPECGEMQLVHFDIQSYLLSALQAERGRLAREVHRLATVYNWSLQEILALSRSQRRMYVALVEAESAYPQRWYE